MAYNRSPFVNTSPKVETVYKKTSIQREYMLKQSSTDALNSSNTSTHNDGVTSDSFIPHGFHDEKAQDSSKKEEKLSSLQSEETISNIEREIQETSDMLRNLSCEFINNTAETEVRYGKQANNQFNAASETSPPPTSRTTVFKSVFERSRNAHGGSTTQEFSSQQGFDERDIDGALAEKGLLAHSTKKLPVSKAQGSDSGDSGLQKEGLFSMRAKGASKDEFSRYENLSDRTRCAFRPYMCLILCLLAVLLALFIVGLAWYLLNEDRMDRVDWVDRVDNCLAELREPLEDFCQLKAPPMRLDLDLDKMYRASNSRYQSKIRYIAKSICSQDPLDLHYATNITRSLLDSLDKRLWPTIGDLTYFEPLFRGHPIHFNVSAKEANATIQLLKYGTLETSYLPAMELALEAFEKSISDTDDRNWMAFEEEFFEKNRGDSILSDTVRPSVISYEGSPKDFYWSLRLDSRCEWIGDIEVPSPIYSRELNDIREKMQSCFAEPDPTPAEPLV